MVAIGAGLYFFRIRNGQRSRLWWGIALILWASARCWRDELRGVQLCDQCAGRPACVWTSWWEVSYLILSVASIDAMMLAEAYSCTVGKWRRVLSVYVVSMCGLRRHRANRRVIPVKFLISFELLILFAAPTIDLLHFERLAVL